MVFCGTCGTPIIFSDRISLAGTSLDAEDLTISDEGSEADLVRVISAVTALGEDSGCSGTSIMELKLGYVDYSVIHGQIKNIPIFFAVPVKQQIELQTGRGMQCADLFLAHVFYLANTLLEHQYGVLLEKLDERSRKEMDGSTFKDTMGKTPKKVQRITEQLFEDDNFGTDQEEVYEDLIEFETSFITRMERERHDLYKTYAFAALHDLGRDYSFFFCYANSSVRGKKEVNCLYQGGGGGSSTDTHTFFSPFHKEIVLGYLSRCPAASGSSGINSYPNPNCCGKSKVLQAEDQHCLLASIGPFTLLLCLPSSHTVCCRILAAVRSTTPLCPLSEYRAWGAEVLPPWLASRWFETLRRLRQFFPPFSPDELNSSLPGTPSTKSVTQAIFDPAIRMVGSVPLVKISDVVYDDHDDETRIKEKKEEHVQEQQELDEQIEEATRAYKEQYAVWDGSDGEQRYENEQDKKEKEEEEGNDARRAASPPSGNNINNNNAVAEPLTPRNGPATYKGITPQPPQQAKTPASSKGGARYFRLFSSTQAEEQGTE